MSLRLTLLATPLPSLRLENKAVPWSVSLVFKAEKNLSKAALIAFLLYRVAYGRTSV